MSTNGYIRIAIGLSCLALILPAVVTQNAAAQDARPTVPPSSSQSGTTQQSPGASTAGGQVTAMGSYSFRVQYLPTEVRVFPLTSTGQPLSAHDLRGEIVMQVRGNPQQFRYPLEFVAVPAGSLEYLVAQVDVTQVRDGDMSVTFRLGNLPLLREPGVEFTQIFALTSSGESVQRVALTAEDAAAIARQRVCPITGEELGSHGESIKLLVNGQPLYVCCEGCVEAVRDNPGEYVGTTRVVEPQRPPAAAAPQITVAQATAADRQAIAQQGTCPVMNQPLGGHGTPLKITIGGQSLFVCCRGCIRKVEQNPQHYLDQAAQLRGGR